MRAVLAVLSAALAIGCSSKTDFRYPGDLDPGGETPDPPALDAGDGRDGSVTISTATVVNTCASISFASASGTSILFADPFAPSVGTRLLVMQVADAFATLGDAAAIVEPGSAGRFELARVSGISSTGAVLVETPLAFEYHSSGGAVAAQACSLPEATSVTIAAGGELRAIPWNGRTGGIAAVLATGTVQVDGAILAEGAGFRGGTTSNPGTATPVTTLSTAAEDGGGKGEGLDAAGWTRFGRGALATAGGGGNSSRAGGGGGANGGPGGLGGTDVTADAQTQGQPGASLDASIAERASLGGGGGGGHQVVQGGLLGGAGGAGGGFVLVVAETIAGTGLIGANGTEGANGGFPVADGSDGGGGGGAGGTILLHSMASSTFNGTIRAAGANGGDVRFSTGPLGGPGGGGGGGRVRLRNVSVSTPPNVEAGVSGVNLDAANDPRGATGGTSGVVEED